jgi:hypothetical protein
MARAGGGDGAGPRADADRVTLEHHDT